jgi:hypothetical protein
MASMEIYPAKTVSGNSPKTRSVIEDAGETFLKGTPVQIDGTSGGIKEWAGTVGTDLIAGIAAQDGSNLATTGAGAPGAFEPITGNGGAPTFGEVPYQSDAVKLARGGPIVDGRCAFYAAAEDTVFVGQVGPAQTSALADVGKSYGLTKDSDGHWYVDRTKTGANAVVKIVGLHPNDGAKLAGRVLFVVEAADAQIIA